MGSKNYSKALEDIKSTVNIVDVIGGAVPLKRAGSGYMACCPFHKEKTPSFSVSESKGFYHCFGCGEHGDVVTFVEKYYNLDFQGAVEKLCAQYGITIEETSGPDDRKRNEYYEANRLAARFFYDNISKKANKGYDYMAGRGLTAKTMQYFGIGYCPEEWTALTDHLRANGVSDRTMLDLGLCSEKNGRVYDKFRGRVIFPIINVRGKVIGFGGRIIGQGEPKYLNSNESSVYLKKQNLYGINRSRDAIVREKYAIVVEGYMDCVSLYQSGIENVVASCGTALTPEQAKLINRYAKKVVLCYDSDKAGIAAALRGIDVLRGAGIEVRVLNVDDGKDPDEYIRKHGREAFLELIEKKSLPDVEYKVKILRESFDISDSTQGIKFLKDLAGIMRSLSPVEADIYIQKYSKEYSISEGALRREVESSAVSSKAAPAAKGSAPGKTPADSAQFARDVNLERMIIRLILLKGSYYETIRDYPEAFVTAKGMAVNTAFEALYSPGRDFDAEAMKNELGEDERDLLERILDKVEVGDDPDRAFDDCVARLKEKRRKKRIREIQDILQMADALPEEAVDQEQIRALLGELQDISNLK